MRCSPDFCLSQPHTAGIIQTKGLNDGFNGHSCHAVAERHKVTDDPRHPT
jgi:hypothetical protein